MPQFFSEQDVNMREVTLQVNEHLSRDRRIQNLFGKIIIFFNYFCKKLRLAFLRGF